MNVTEEGIDFKGESLLLRKRVISSVGRVPRLQRECQRFESVITQLEGLEYSQAVRRRFLVSRFKGSNPFTPGKPINMCEH